MTKIYKVKVEGNTYEVELELVSESSASMSAPVVATPSATTPATTAVTGTGIPVTSPMQGNIWKILKKTGETVKAGETILILEAMKMENNIVAPKDGTITAIAVKEGDTVDSGALLAELA